MARERSDSKTYIGINIQYPISRDILEGRKTIETRKYPIPADYIGRDLVVIETPGKTGNFKARMIGFVRFGESFEYTNKQEFYRDSEKHLVESGSIWEWQDGQKKFGWPVVKADRWADSIQVSFRKGICFSRGISLTVGT